MAIRATITPEVTTPKTSYPCLGIYKDTGGIVLFDSSYTGTVIAWPNGINTVGEYCRSWASDWVPFTGTVTLENK